MDVSFKEAMRTMESAYAPSAIPVFDGLSVKGVAYVCLPTACRHGEPLVMMTRSIRTRGHERAVVSYECGCAYLGRFELSGTA